MGPGQANSHFAVTWQSLPLLPLRRDDCEAMPLLALLLLLRLEGSAMHGVSLLAEVVTDALSVLTPSPGLALLPSKSPHTLSHTGCPTFAMRSPLAES